MSDDLNRLITLCKVVIDQAKMGDFYLISFVKRELFEEFRELVDKIENCELKSGRDDESFSSDF